MAKKLYLYLVTGAVAQVEFPEYKPAPKKTAEEKAKEKADGKETVAPEPELFPRASADRGALYLRPGSTVELTEEEHLFILHTRPDLARSLQYQGYEFKDKPEAPKPLLPPGGDGGPTNVGSSSSFEASEKASSPEESAPKKGSRSSSSSGS